MPNVTEWDEAKQVPEYIFKQMGERGYLAGLLGMHYPTHLTNARVKSVPPEKWDLFHELIITDELSRSGSGGLVWNLIGGYGIGGGNAGTPCGGAKPCAAACCARCGGKFAKAFAA